MIKCRVDSNECTGEVSKAPVGRNLYLCHYHRELVVQLKRLTLVELERIMGATSVRQVEQHVGQARRLALCSSPEEFKRHVFNVYTGAYDYTRHA
jgi:hypothetical protein